MKRLAIYKVAALAAALAIGGVGTDAFARGGDGGHASGGHVGASHAAVGGEVGVGGVRSSGERSFGRTAHGRNGWVSYQTRMKRWSEYRW